MSRKRIMSVVIALVFGFAVGGLAIAAEDSAKGPATIVLKAKKGNVTFEHHKHQEKFKCGDCHHGPGHSAYKEGMKIHECQECHNKDDAKMPKKLQKTMNAFHTNCKGCHKEHKAEKAPTKCSGCHKK